METTEHGLKKPASSDFYNIDDFNANTDIIETHLNDTESHVNAAEIIEITEATELDVITTGDTNDTIWGKIKKAISVLISHIGTVATGSVLGHIKIGTGLQMSSGTASVKLANNLTTNDTTTALTAAMGYQLNTNLINKIYPVGSIYMSANNVSPASFIGGTWVRITDRFLIGAGNTYGINSTGGESTHLLNNAELPSDIGSFQALSWWDTNNTTGKFSKVQNYLDRTTDIGSSCGTSTFTLSGGNTPHNNMPPYLAVYIWKRTA